MAGTSAATARSGVGGVGGPFNEHRAIIIPKINSTVRAHYALESRGCRTGWRELVWV